MPESTDKPAETAKQQTAKGARAAKQAGQEIFDGSTAFMKLPEETFRFASHRFDRQMNHVKELMGCRSPSEYFDCQSRFATEAVEEYMEEAKRVTDLASEIGTEYLSRVANTADKTRG